MKWRLLLLTALLSLFCTSAFTPPPAVGDDLLTHEIRADLEKTLDLWRDERYGESILFLLRISGETGSAQ